MKSLIAYLLSLVLVWSPVVEAAHFSADVFSGAINYPTVVSTATTYRNSNSTSDTINMPSGIHSGDFLLCNFSFQIASTYSSTGWTEITATPDARFHSFYKISAGTEGATQTFNGGTTHKVSALCARFTNAAASSPIDTSTWASNTANKFTGTGSVASNVLTITVASSGSISLNDLVAGVSVPSSTTITAMSPTAPYTGTGGTGTYGLSTSSTIGSETIYASLGSVAASSVTPGVSKSLLITSYFYTNAEVVSDFSMAVDVSETKIGDSTAQTDFSGNTLAVKQLYDNSATGALNGTPNYALYSFTALSVTLKSR